MIQIERAQGRAEKSMDRRRFLGAAVAACLVNGAAGMAEKSADLRRAGRSIVPAKSSESPNYWCTWAVQNYMYGHHLAKLDPEILEGSSGNKLAHEAMTEQALFGPGGWANRFYDRVRSDLFLLLDDGWESGGTSTFELNVEKFPSFAGSAAERLAKLNRAIQEQGWRGAGLWCRDTPGGDADFHLESLSASAEIKYWKIDIGDPSFNLVRIRNSAQIPLTLEHVHGEQPANGDWKRDGRFGPQPWNSRRIQILLGTDIYRTYDVTSILSLPTTLDRVAEMLRTAAGHSELRSLLNVEDEVYVAAALGCTMGIMRHPLIGLRPEEDTDLFFNGPRQPKKRMDEVVRALRWQRIAPPFPSGLGCVELSEEVLTDAWHFERGQTWQSELVENTVRQGAPAVITRNLPLAEVRSIGARPFVFASRFPNGAVAVAAQERTQVNKAWFMSPCEVTLNVSDACGPFGIFGDFELLTLVSDKSYGNRSILAQDLAGDEAFDISHEVTIRGNSLQIPGSVIRTIGLQSATAGDFSSPGLVLALQS
jgi:hypothetical protein